MFIKAFGNGIQIRIILSGNISLTPWYEDLKTNLIQKAENWACMHSGCKRTKTYGFNPFTVI